MYFADNVFANVLKKHINMGSQSEKCYCPIALSLLETGRYDLVNVGSKEVRIGKFDSVGQLITRTYKLSRAAIQFVSAFDDSKKSVKPGEFTLTLKP